MTKLLEAAKAQQVVFALREGKAVNPKKIANIIERLLDDRRNLLDELDDAREGAASAVFSDLTAFAKNILETMEELEELRGFKKRNENTLLHGAVDASVDTTECPQHLDGLRSIGKSSTVRKVDKRDDQKRFGTLKFSVDADTGAAA